jgi:uroporphyrinogen decarboxylase
MTPLERFALLLMDERPDRLIAAPLMTTAAAAFAGLSPGACCRDGALLSRAQLSAQEALGHDAFFVFSDVAIIAEAMGSTLRHAEDRVPLLDSPVVREARDVDALIVPGPDRGRLPVYLDAVRMLNEARGDRVPVFCLVPAPFTTAAGLRGAEDFLVDTIADPPLAEALVLAAERATIPLLDAIVLAGGLPALVDPLASASVAAPRTYRALALPGTRRLVERLHRLDLDVLLHVCGDVDPILKDLAATGADLLSFDHTTVAAVRSAVGERMRLVGNVSPLTILSGRPADVTAEAHRAIREGVGAPKGFVLSTGCEVPPGSPPENLAAFFAAAAAAGGVS